MTAIRRLQCPACGAGLDVPADQRRLACPYCGTTLAVEVTQGEATLGFADQVVSALREEGDRTQAALQRVALGQRRAQLVDELPRARADLGAVEGELGHLNRLKKKDRRAKWRIQQLVAQRQQIYQRMGTIQGEIAHIDATLYPPPPSPTAAQPSSAQSLRTKPGAAPPSNAERRFLAAFGYGIAAMFSAALLLGLLTLPLRFFTRGTAVDDVLSCLNASASIAAFVIGAWFGLDPARRWRQIATAFGKVAPGAKGSAPPNPVPPTPPQPSSGPIACPQCGTSHATNVATCWKCGAEMKQPDPIAHDQPGPSTGHDQLGDA